jgi:hypothetical protein
MPGGPCTQVKESHHEQCGSHQYCDRKLGRHASRENITHSSAVSADDANLRARMLPGTPMQCSATREAPHQSQQHSLHLQHQHQQHQHQHQRDVEEIFPLKRPCESEAQADAPHHFLLSNDHSSHAATFFPPAESRGLGLAHTSETSHQQPLTVVHAARFFQDSLYTLAEEDCDDASNTTGPSAGTQTKEMFAISPSDESSSTRHHCDPIGQLLQEYERNMCWSASGGPPPVIKTAPPSASTSWHLPPPPPNATDEEWSFQHAGLAATTTAHRGK